MPEIGNGGKQFFRAYSFEYVLGVPAARAATGQEPFNRYTRIKNKALSGHLARRGRP